MFSSLLLEIDKILRVITAHNCPTGQDVQVVSDVSSLQVKVSLVAQLVSKLREFSRAERIEDIFENMKSGWLEFVPNLDRVSILLYDPEADALFDSKYYTGLLATPVGVANHPIGFSISGTVFLRKESIYLYDCTQSDLIPKQIVESLQLKSVYAVPLIYKRTVAGVVRFDSMSNYDAFPGYLREILDYTVWLMGVLFEQTSLPQETKEFLRRLEVSEQKNRVLLSALPDTYFMVDREGRYLDYYANDEKKFVVPPVNFLGTTMRDIFGDKESAGFYEHLNKLFATGVAQTYEYEYPFDDEIKYFSTRLLPFDSRRCLVIDTETTEERKAHIRVQESEERFRSFYELAPSGVLILNKEGKILQTNRSMELLLEYEYGALDNRYIYEFSPPDVVKMNFPFFYSVALKGKSFYEFEHKLRTKTGRILFVQVRMSILKDSDDDEDAIEIIAHISDVSKLRGTLDTLQQKELFLGLLSGLSYNLLRGTDIHTAALDAMKKVISLTSTNAVFIYRIYPRNRVFSHYASWRGKKGVDGFEDDDRILNRKELLNKRISQFAAGEIFKASRKNAIRDIYFYLKFSGVSSMVAVPVLVHGKLWGVCGIEDEIHLRDWQPSEIDLIQTIAGSISAASTIFDAQTDARTELNRSKFLADLMRHDITNHNNAVFPILDMVLSETQQADDLYPELVTCFEESQDISRLINNFRIFEELTGSSISLQPGYSLQRSITEVIEVFNRSFTLKPLNLEFHDECAPSAIPGNAYLNTVIENIIRNSIKYSDKESIDISVRLADVQNESAVELTITDNARGIRNEERKKVFSRVNDFEGADTGSRTGFGLTVSAKIIKLLNGSISVLEREHGNYSAGSVVRIVLPVTVRESL